MCPLKLLKMLCENVESKEKRDWLEGRGDLQGSRTNFTKDVILGEGFFKYFGNWYQL